jgi:hypothetical protein
MILRADRLGPSARDAHEIERRVARCTVGANVALVRIAVALKAAVAAHRERHVQFRDADLLPIGNAQRGIAWTFRLVAERARHVLMCSTTRELRHRVVPELRCLFERHRAVTLVATWTKPTLVLVVFLMAVVATALAELVLAVDVTRNTRNAPVFAREWVGLMVEFLAARRVEMQKR